MSRRSRLGGVPLRALAGIGLCLAAAGPALAVLGGPRDSVEADRVHFAARLATVQRATHTVHTLSLPNGGVVHELTRPDGVVFALTWRGPGRADLRQLLGSNFEALQAASVGPRGRRLRRPLAVNRPDLQIQTGGHPGAFWGVAFMPGLAPAGFTPASLASEGAAP